MISRQFEIQCAGRGIFRVVEPRSYVVLRVERPDIPTPLYDARVRMGLTYIDLAHALGLPFETVVATEADCSKISAREVLTTIGQMESFIAGHPRRHRRRGLWDPQLVCSCAWFSRRGACPHVREVDFLSRMSPTCSSVGGATRTARHLLRRLP